MKLNEPKISLIVFIVVILSVVVLGVSVFTHNEEVPEEQPQILGVSIPNHLQLKTTKDKINFSTTTADIREVDREFVNVGQMKKYWYENEEVLETTFEGLPEEISLRTMYSFTYNTGLKNDFEKPIYKTVFNKEPKIKKNGKWFAIKNATTTIEAYDEQIETYDEQTEVSWLKRLFGEPVMATVSRFDEDDILEEVTIQSYNAVFATARSGANLSVNGTLDRILGFVWWHGSLSYIIQRAGFCFDTSAIPADDEITAAEFQGWVTVKNVIDNDDQAYNAITTSTPANASSWATSDWNNFGTGTTTEAISDDYRRVEDQTLNATTTWDFNQAGIDWISKGVGAETCLGTREGHDIENVAFITTLGRTGLEMAGIRHASGRSGLLVVTHASAVSPTTPDLVQSYILE